MTKHPVRRRDIFDTMRRRFDDVFSDPFFRDYGGFPFSMLKEPYADMIETDKEVIFTAEIPGVKKEDININVTEDRIDVSVDVKSEKEKKGKKEYSYETRYQGFNSSYSTPAPINTNSVKASYKNGVLEVRASKIKAAKGRSISVE